jgi:hypothetical protein
MPKVLGNQSSGEPTREEADRSVCAVESLLWSVVCSVLRVRVGAGRRPACGTWWKGLSETQYNWVKPPCDHSGLQEKPHGEEGNWS